MGWKIRKDGKFDTGRKEKIDEDVLNKLYTAFSQGNNDEDACEFAQVSTTCFYNYQKRNPEFKEWKDGLKRRPILKAKNTVIQHLDDPKIALEYLKAKCKDEFGQRMEVTGANGEALSMPSVINVVPVRAKEDGK